LKKKSKSSFKAPVLTNFAGTSGPLGDLSPVGTSVHQFTVTDQDDAISCSINAPESAKFGITKVNTATGSQRKFGDVITLMCRRRYVSLVTVIRKFSGVILMMMMIVIVVNPLIWS